MILGLARRMKVPLKIILCFVTVHSLSWFDRWRVCLFYLLLRQTRGRDNYAAFPLLPQLYCFNDFFSCVFQEYQSFTDLQYSKDKTVTWVDWHPQVNCVYESDILRPGLRTVRGLTQVILYDVCRSKVLWRFRVVSVWHLMSELTTRIVCWCLRRSFSFGVLPTRSIPK